MEIGYRRGDCITIVRNSVLKTLWYQHQHDPTIIIAIERQHIVSNNLLAKPEHRMALKFMQAAYYHEHQYIEDCSSQNPCSVICCVPCHRPDSKHTHATSNNELTATSGD